MIHSLRRLKNGLTSIALRKYLSDEKRRVGNFVVCGFPKSGTTWITQLIGHSTKLTYSQNRIRFRTKGVMLHTHWTSFSGSSGIIYVVRDPRETICSAARAMAARNKSGVFRRDGTLSIEFTKFACMKFPGSTTSLNEHLQKCVDNQWRFVKFEDMKHDPATTLKAALNASLLPYTEERLKEALIKFDFDSLKVKDRNNAFLAESSTSSWRSLLCEESHKIIVDHCGRAASAFEYNLIPEAIYPK